MKIDCISSLRLVCELSLLNPFSVAVILRPYLNGSPGTHAEPYLNLAVPFAVGLLNSDISRLCKPFKIALSFSNVSIFLVIIVGVRNPKVIVAVNEIKIALVLRKEFYSCIVLFEPHIQVLIKAEKAVFSFSVFHRYVVFVARFSGNAVAVFFVAKRRIYSARSAAAVLANAVLAQII